jgi:hypothetical protein
MGSYPWEEIAEAARAVLSRQSSLTLMCHTYHFSRAVGRGIFRRVRKKVPLTDSCLRVGGRPRAFPPEEKEQLKKVIRAYVILVAEKWEEARSRAGTKTRPKTARPLPTMAGIRNALKLKNINCPDTSLGRVLAEMAIVTAGQKALRRRRRA